MVMAIMVTEIIVMFLLRRVHPHHTSHLTHLMDMYEYWFGLRIQWISSW